MAESETDELQDTEITLTTGKLLGIFFGLVLLCSFFFTLGYILGRSNASGSKAEIVAGQTSGSTTAGKPSAVNKNSEVGPAVSAATSQPTQASGASASPAPSPAATLVPASSSTGSDAQNAAASNATYTVQVAAVSKREDADLLVSALQKKQYPVFVATVPGDVLFHIQVGPFTDSKEAETMRGRLANEGYNPIVKSNK